MNEREAYIALNMMEDIGPVGVRSLIALLGTPQAIFDVERERLFEAQGIGPGVVEKISEQRCNMRPAEELKRAAGLGAAIITPADGDYPKSLAQIHDPPLALYVLGKLIAPDQRAIGMVGARHTTMYGRETAESLAYQLAHAGFTVVSGLARGIDTAAHRGALKAKGRTLAVLGGGLDYIYPAENKQLAAEIAENGAVLSEFPIGRKPDKTTFPIRNRIISGLSMGVVVVEAGLTSGALITANQALEQGRCVFAVPGRIDSPSSKGTHRLIKNGARLVENVDDILQEFEFLIPRPNLAKPIASGDKDFFSSLDNDEKKIVQCLEDGEKNADEVIRATGIGANRFGAVLLGLEMKRVIRLQPGRMIHLIRRFSTAE
ncbi:MAG: DNA-processing protein DprA [Kiritimatiellia bacterium]|nr:DNA-processing protein DprA [Kiritimatiellia bacterium]